jgi:DNA-binding GntR family transcriptional regulator
VELASRLECAIGAGEHPVGSLLPTEIELCARFGVSRHTVREALRSLRESGLVTRRQGSGTQVIAAASRGTYVQSLASVDDVLQYARDTSLEVESRRRVVARGPLARLLGCTPGQRWVAIAALRRAGSGAEPICVTDIYLDPDYASVVPRIGRSRGAVHALIEAEHALRIEEIVQSISAVVLDSGQAERLGSGEGEAALRIVRRYLGPAGRLVEASVSVHPADRFTYSMRIRREAPQGTA